MEQNNFITQAVILAGGRGERMRPFTDTMPKPMVAIHDKPFLEHLLLLLKKNGIREVLVLSGYLAEKIEEYFGDGSKWGMRISYSVLPLTDENGVENESGTRIMHAKEKLHDEFLLMYCDNYWPLRLDRLYKFHKEQGRLATVTVYANSHLITKNNMRVEDGIVRLYDPKRITSDLTGVDIGFFVLKKEVLKYAPEGKFKFEREVLPRLIKDNELAGYLTEARYYSIGSEDRLPLTSEFLSDKKVILLDRDGVINKRPPKAEYVKKWSEFEFLPYTLAALKFLNDNGYKTYLISNQPGIARGAMTQENLEEINRNLVSSVENAGGRIEGIYQCLHNWDDGCRCRKPKPGMLYDAAFDHNFDLSKAVFIGDDERDAAAGEAAGVKTILMESDGNLLEVVKSLIKSTEV